MDMMTGKEDLLSALIEAYLMEKGTRVFYAAAAERAVKAEVKKMFTALSDWEERHMHFIQYLYQEIQDDRDMKGFTDFAERTEAPVTEAGIPVKDLDARLEKYDFIDDNGAIQLALEIEGKAYNLYRKISENASDSNARVVFREMMEQEQKHIDYLKNMGLTIA